MAGSSATDEIRAVADQLRAIVGQITPEEFRWQEGNYDRDSPLGRELLFLIANNEWARATAETIDITRSDAVETMIKIDTDLDRITHEAFRHRTGRLWLPVVVLPPLRQRLPEPDPFVTLTVTDAGGNLLATLPSADVRHRISAALAEIIVNMAVARWPGMRGDGPTATRDQRLLLSAAIYRLLRSERVDPPTGQGIPVTAGIAEPLPRISNARRELDRLLGWYRSLLHGNAADQEARAVPLGTPGGEPGGAGRYPAGAPFARQLTERAVMVLRAFAESAVVVVAVERDDTPTVLTVRVPSRALHLAPSIRRASRPRTWHWLRPATWNWILPRAHLQVDLLLPSADADRQVEVNLPDGVSFDPSRPLPTRAEMEIRVKPPPPLQHLSQLMHQLLDAPADWPPPLYQCLADLAGVKAEAARESLRYHKVGSTSEQASSTANQTPSATRAVRARLDELRAGLSQLSASGHGAEPAASLKPVWRSGDWLLSPPLQRRTSADALSPRAVVARAGMIEDVSKRAAPEDAKIHVYVAVTDAEYFSVARFSGWMSALLMMVVLFFLLYEKLLRVNSEQVSPEVLAIVLTLFSAIQAGRIERSDRSTIRGLLALAGNKLIVASILPTVILAVALAFSRTGTWPIAWAGGCIFLQLLLQSLLRLRLLRALQRGSRPTVGSQPLSGLTLHTDPPDYTHSEVLHSSWWRSTTADALMIGCQAYGYVVWQRGASPTLRELLIDARPASPPPYLKPASHSRLVRGRWIRWLAEPAAETSPGVSGKESVVSTGTLPAGPDGSPGPGADDATSSRTAILDNPPNVLALQRSGTVGQSLTFVVFREQPKADWVTSDHVFPVDIDPDQLAPVDDVTGTVEIFLGLPPGAGPLKVADHPVTAILAAAEHRLHVLEVQLPVPAPSAEYSDRQWARVQMAMRESDIEHLAAFLSAVHQRIAGSHQFQPQNGQPDDRCIVGVKTISEGAPRIINPRPDLQPASSGLVLASDIDVITASGSHPGESEDARTWRVLAICADARSGIENDIVRNLGKELRVAALTYALLHGKAVILLLGHQPGERTYQVNFRDTFVSDRSGANFQVLLDEWQSRKDLGTAGPDPLLRVHIRSPDRPGATLDVLESLRETLQTLAPGSLRPSDWNVWYARTEVTAGNAALLLLTVRLSVDPQLVRNWRPADFEEIERRVRTLAARKAAAAANIFNDDLGAQKDTVISVKLITVHNLNVS